MNDYEQACLLGFVRVMRSSCDDAEREIREGGLKPTASVVGGVLSALDWGRANASSSLQCALSSVAVGGGTRRGMRDAATDNE